MSPLKIPVRKVRRFSWRSLLGFVSLLLFLVKGVKFLGRKIHFK